MSINDKISDFLSYWCMSKCPYKNYSIFKDDDPVDVNFDDCDIECVCPKCGEKFEETVDSSDIDYTLSDRYDFPDKYCECCQVEKFVEELKYELS
jgi:hypothetical protein